ncbi:MAG TPA: hypothetical protein VHC22_20930 [Pirellulales bacterium]|nr:hypothetical protein [Pirellulales bacterium]
MSAMIFRLSQKLNDKIKAGRLGSRPLDENPFADWSATLFTADRTQYILLSNSKSLYSTVLYAKGITNDSDFIERAMSSIRDFMENDGLAFMYQRFIAPSGATVGFAKALNRSVTGSMNDLIRHAEYWLTNEEISPHDVSLRLNGLLMSALAPTKAEVYGKPREAFKAMDVGGRADDLHAS